MQAQEKQLIDDLAKRLESSSGQTIDPQAQELISKEIASQPHAVYLLTQAVLLQEQALREQKQQLEELKSQLQQQSGRSSFLGGLFGQKRGSCQGQPSQLQGSGYPTVVNPGNSGRFTGDSFLGRAASTAIGVAGGAMLFEGISHLFSPGESLLGGQPAELVNQTFINEAPQMDAEPYMGDVSQGSWLADDNTTPFIDSNNLTDSSWGGADFSDTSFSGDFDSDW